MGSFLLLATLLLLLCSSLTIVEAFSPVRVPLQQHRHHHTTTSHAHHQQQEGGVVEDEPQSRRDFIADTTFRASSLLVATGLLQQSPTAVPPANAADGGGGSPICVIGANGKTGSRCVKACLDRKIPVIATSRTGVYNGDDATNSLVSTAVCDVTQPSTIQSAITSDTRAVIFAASASKQGGTPTAVDNEGLVNCYCACIDAKVPHLVIVSSGGVSKPDSSVYKFLNLFGGIMKQKIIGEDSVRAMYKEGTSSSSTTYTIVRPGGLTEEPGLGVAGLELNQGDTKSGRISRSDVASLCVESTFYPKLTGGATFECYNADTGKTLDAVGVSNILKQTTSEGDTVNTSGKERRGTTFQEIFTGLKKDV